MANRRRGEVGLDLADARWTLCLTLGALAELEDALGAPDLVALGDRLAAGRLSGRDLPALLAIALRGGGHAVDAAWVRALPLADGDLAAILEALVAVFAAAFGEEDGKPGGEPPADPPRPREG